MSQTSPLMNVMIKAAEKAGRTLTRDFGEVENLQVSRKGPSDFVTAADKRAEEIIFEELKHARPKYSFMMEESGEVKGEDTDHVWIIDPLDGTHNFMHGVPHWCVSIALEIKGRLEIAVVYDPIKEEVFRAERSSGAFVGRTRLRVSGRADMESAMITYGSTTPDPVKKALYYFGHRPFFSFFNFFCHGARSCWFRRLCSAPFIWWSKRTRALCAACIAR